jgi:PLP dependent protein
VAVSAADGGIAQRLSAVHERIAAACRSAGRAPEEVRLLAVSKRHTVESMRAAYAAGQREFGENYVKELAQKAEALRDLPDLRLRLIGRLQSNKVKDVVRIGCSVDTVDSIALASALEAGAEKQARVLEVFVQVNVGEEPQKAGVPIAGLLPLTAAIRECKSLRLRGLLAIPPVAEDPEQNRGHFRRMRELAAACGVRELSMGMSDDLEVAVQEGATMVRVGTAIFGPRPT